MAQIETIIDRLAAARLSLGLTPEQLGEAVGVSGRSICRYEDGTRKITLETMLRLAAALNKDIAWFFTGNQSAASNKIFSLSDEESRILKIYRMLNEEGKQFLLECANNASEVSRYAQWENEVH